MAIVTNRKNILHIQWYDPITGKTNSCTTKLADNQNKHHKTIKDYHRFYRKFSEAFDLSEPCPINDKFSVESWFSKIKKLNLSKNTIHGYGKQCIHFLNFLFEYSYVIMFKVNREVKIRPEEKEKIIMRDEDINKIFIGIQSKNSNFQTLTYLLFYTDLRESDLLSLTVDKIDLEQREMYYYMQKGKKHRHIPFHKGLVPILKSRMVEIKEGKILNYTNVENMGRAITRYYKEFRIDNKDYKPKTFRKTFITLCRNRFQIGASIVKELVGHSHGNVTDKYYNLIDVQTLKNELKKFNKP